MRGEGGGCFCLKGLWWERKGLRGCRRWRDGCGLCVCCCRGNEIGEAGAVALAGVLGGLVNLQSLDLG